MKNNNKKQTFFFTGHRKLQNNFHVLSSLREPVGINRVAHVFSIMRMTQYLQCDIPCAVFNMFICLLSHRKCLEKSTAAYFQAPIAPIVQALGALIDPQ